MKERMLKLVPWLLLAVFTAEIVTILLPKRDKDFHLQGFGRLPVLLGGRIQPMDTMGRNALLQIRETASVPLEEKKSYEFWKHPKKLKATEWAMEVMMKPEEADKRPIFLIHHPDLLNELELRGRGKEKSGLFYFSHNELADRMVKIDKEGQQVMAVEAQARTAYQKQVAKLYSALGLYRRLKNTLQPDETRDFVQDLIDFKKTLPAGIAAVKASRAGQPFDKPAFDKFARFLSQYHFMVRLNYAMILPPSHPEQGQDKWQSMGQTLFDAGVNGAELPPTVEWFAAMANGFRQNRPEEFNRALADYQQWLEARLMPAVDKGRYEYFYNNLQAFLHAMIIYICAFLLAIGAMLSGALWPRGAEALRRSATWLICLAWIVHTAGILFRMYLERRPPVTNLYSSAVFIGWVSVVLGLILERSFRVGIGAAVASLVGFVTLIIAHNLALGGDTMEQLRAVLDTNFWLATHVITITLGYAANFVAGLLGVIYIVLGVFTPLLSRNMDSGSLQAAPGKGESASAASVTSADETRLDLGQVLNKMVYGVICFAMLFSFVGTVLGGIWADQSWGRFWGWDPKENGALIIVLWNAMILHARWDGQVRERGLMNLAIFGNIVTAFSWFGVNMLGIGLHSYGFMDAAFQWLMIVTGAHLLLIGLGLLPSTYWRSRKAAQVPALPTASQP